MWIEIVIIILSLIVNAIFACSEIAFVTVRRAQVKRLANTDDKKAKLLLEMREHPERTLSVVQVVITFAAILGAAFGGSGAESALTPVLENSLKISNDLASILSVIIVVIPLTYFTVVIGELVPKIIGMKHSLFFARGMAKVFYWTGTIFYPVIRILEWSTKKLVALFFMLIRIPIKKEEIDDPIELAELPLESRRYVLNIVDLEQKMVREVAIDLNEVICISENQSMDEVEAIAIDSKHTRLPVYKERDIIGILHTKELYAAKKKDPQKSWKELIRPIPQFNEDTSVLAAILEMQKAQTHMAATKQNNQITGILTLEDLLEEIVGDIYDEDDPGANKRRPA